MSHYTQKAILETFQDMLVRMPFDKITVSALVANCEISPNTFYYHYRDIYDLLDVWMRQVMKEHLVERLQVMSWTDALKHLLREMKAHPDLIYHLFNSLSRERIERYIFESTDDTFYQIVRKEIGDASVPEETIRSVTEYNSYALLGFFLKFLWNRMGEDIDEVVDPIGRIFTGSIKGIIEMQER